MRVPAATVLLDSEGLSLVLRGDHAMGALLRRMADKNIPAIVSALTVIEAAQGRTNLRHLEFVLSGFRVEPVLKADAKTAVGLLRAAAGLSGHTHAIDAAVAALALRLPGPVLVVTSDPVDWERLVGDRVYLHIV